MTARRLLEIDPPTFVLAPPTAADTDVIVEHCQDPAIEAWTTVPAPYRREHAVEFLRDVDEGWANGSMLTWSLRWHDRLVGMLGLDLQPVRSAEIGWWLAPQARGRGLMTRAVAAVVTHAVEPDGVGLDRVFWQAFVGNDPSRRIAERVGFTVEGTVRGHGIQRGARRDAWVGTLLRTDPRP